jgi:hypothetical protein
MPPQASLHRLVKTHRTSVGRMAPLFRAFRERAIQRHWVAIALPSGEMFCEGIRKLACECLSKRLRNSRDEINPGFSVEQTGSTLSVLIHEIRG